MKILDKILLLLSVGVGLFLGLLLISKHALVQVAGWVGLLLGLAIVLILWLFVKMTDIPREWLFDKFTHDNVYEESPELKTATRIANGVGVIGAFGATKIWSTAQIMSLF